MEHRVLHGWMSLAASLDVIAACLLVTFQLSLSELFFFLHSFINIQMTSSYKMGGWDIYCAFCGASFQTYGAFDLMGGAYNPDLINAQGECHLLIFEFLELINHYRVEMAG